MEDKTGIVRSEISLDINIVSNIIYIIISIAHLSLFWVFNLIFSEYRTNSEEVPNNNLRFSRPRVRTFKWYYFQFIHHIYSSLIFHKERVACFVRPYSLSQIGHFNQPLRNTSEYVKTIHNDLYTAPARSTLSS